MTVDELGREMRTAFERIERTLAEDREVARADRDKLWEAHTELSKETAATTKDHHGKIEGLKVLIGIWAGGASLASAVVAWAAAKFSGSGH